MVGINLEGNESSQRENGIGVLVNYKLRSNYAEVQVFIQKEKGVYRNITKHNQLNIVISL